MVIMNRKKQINTDMMVDSEENQLAETLYNS